LVLVDGEHYPPVTRWAIEVARSRGYEVVGGLLIGGAEKLTSEGAPDLGIPVAVVEGTDRATALRRAIDDHVAEVVLDLSDEPILGYRERMAMASVALWRGVAYHGPDFRLDPPAAEPPPSGVSTVAVTGTGKRTGKTAIAGALARRAAALGLDPVIVAMGRGGPSEPEVAEAGSVTLPVLLELSRSGRHAASDYLEGAVTTGVATVGARRAGGGLAGTPFVTNVGEALAVAADRHPGVVVLEGSGAAIPTVDWDAGILVVPAGCPPEYLQGYLGRYRLLRTDVAIVTMAAESVSGLDHFSALTSHLRSALGDARCAITDFRPAPLADVRGEDAFFATTAPEGVAARQVAHLESAFGCRIVGWSARLADRAGLAEDLDGAHGYDVLLTELKAAAIDVAAERARARGAEVVFVDNRADVIGAGADLDTVLEVALNLAAARSKRR
jgi:cyclic 2,3-diphosphoglycerate synthase